MHLEQRDGRTVTYDALTLAAWMMVPSALDSPEPGMVLRPPDARPATRRGARPAWFRSREGWHWLIVEDCYELARRRWGGVVPDGHRDRFGFKIACQIARIVHPGVLWHEIIAAVGRIVPHEFLGRELHGYCSTLMARARAAFETRTWSTNYRLPKSRMIDVLGITSDEMRPDGFYPGMRALIDEAEARRRNAAREQTRRAAAGAVDRGAYEAQAAERRAMVILLRREGLSWAEVGERMGMSATAARLRGRHTAE